MNKPLKELSKNKTYEEITSNMSISANYFGRIIRGERSPTLHVAKEIADYFDVTIDYIFFNRDVSKRH
ncbi:helix-turn-helix transcriptional regulator [Listeria monocytogenes]|nr:helix-turn-helix transcriptional regulator [Listeria monocytogenes]EIL5159746.1 helix-turn-helix transcriptional regulator [Listeria monocytogenes]